MIGRHERNQNLPAAARVRRTRADQRRHLRLDVPRIGDEHRSVLAQAGARAAHVDQAVHASQRHELRRERPARAVVRRRRAQRRGELPRPASRETPRADGDPLGARRSERIDAAHQLSRAARERLQVRERAEAPRRQERRPRHDLHADDSRNRDRDARVRTHRRGALRRVRRLLARGAQGPHRGLRVAHRDHGRRRRAGRQEDSAEGERRRSAEERARLEGRARRRRQAHGRQASLGRTAATSGTRTSSTGRRRSARPSR